ncbi:MAG: hypothetical protein LAO07_20220 [Acidobacteriia bacterium]|nr:hypothetical protein [Terriglobia bacterium]
MTLPLEQRFTEELSVLEELFSETKVRKSLPRLNEIYSCTEERWQEYAEQLPGGQVNYLLIAEAPPWRHSGSPQYVLDPASRPRTLMRALRKALSLSEQHDGGWAMKQFAQRGLLIVDSIPFAMNYSAKRSSVKYDRLVQLTAQSLLQEKLESTSLSWSRCLRIAFSVQLNAKAVMRGLRHGLSLGGRQFTLSPEMIAVNGAGYPDADKLRKVWGMWSFAIHWRPQLTCPPKTVPV